MKLGVDLTWMIGAYRGMGRFARQLVAPVSDSVIGLAPSGVVNHEWPCVSDGRAFFPWWEQIDLPRHCREQQLDYLLCPYNTGPLRSLGSTRLISVVHDLIFLQPWTVLPPSMSPYQNVGRIYRRLTVPALVKRADTILTVSHYTRNELERQFGLPEHSIRVIPNAIADVWLVDAPAPRAERGPYLFTVAGEAPSKNVARLLQAFAKLGPVLEPQAVLRIAGIKPENHAHFHRQAEALGLTGRVELLGYLPEPELRAHYRAARGFVFASLFEGFGIPLLEAMASGTPVACSNTTSMPEILGGHGLLFDPHSIDDMAQQMRKLWEGGATLEVMTGAALQHARSYSESAVAQLARDFWESLQ